MKGQKLSNVCSPKASLSNLKYTFALCTHTLEYSLQGALCTQAHSSALALNVHSVVAKIALVCVWGGDRGRESHLSSVRYAGPGSGYAMMGVELVLALKLIELI